MARLSRAISNWRRLTRDLIFVRRGGWKNCVTRGVVTTTENGCRLLDRDDPGYILSFREVALYAGYVVGGDFHTSAFDGVFNALSRRADPYQFKGTSARCEHPFDHTCGFGCLVTRTYLKTDRPIKLNIEATLHRHERNGANLLKYKF